MSEKWAILSCVITNVYYGKMSQSHYQTATHVCVQVAMNTKSLMIIRQLILIKFPHVHLEIFYCQTQKSFLATKNFSSQLCQNIKSSFLWDSRLYHSSANDIRKIFLFWVSKTLHFPRNRNEVCARHVKRAGRAEVVCCQSFSKFCNVRYSFGWDLLTEFYKSVITRHMKATSI